MPVLEVASTGPLLVGPRPSESSVDLSMVLPTSNEAQNITAVVEQLDAVLDAISNLRYEIIVVDDDSEDRTWDHALGLTERISCLRVIRRQGERGLSTAVVRGWQLAQGKILGVMDADLQHPPDVAAKLWAEMACGVDLAVASRHTPGGGVSDWKFRRRIISRSAQLAGLVLLPEVIAKVKDPMSGYFMIRRSTLEQRELRPLGYKILIELLGRVPVRSISEVPYTFRERADGASKVTSKIYLEYVHHLIRLRVVSLNRLFRSG
jgi:dolichol-phosphate mannosyltransferase